MFMNAVVVPKALGNKHTRRRHPVPRNDSMPNHCRRKTTTRTTGIAARTGKTTASEYRFYRSLTTSTLVLVRSQWTSSPV